MSGYKHRSFYEYLAFATAILTLVAMVLAFVYPCLRDVCGNAAITFATLTGAILVFSTLEIQRKALQEDKSKNDESRFDSHFYPILSSFRKDAADFEIIGDSLSDGGIGVRKSYKGENGFRAARSMARGVKEYVKDKDFVKFDRDDFDIDLDEFSKIFDAIYDDFPLEEELDKVEAERRQFIKSRQIPYLMSKMGITKAEAEEYKQKGEKEIESFLLEKLVEYQSATLSKYVKSLRFLIHIIEDELIESKRSKYFMHIATLLGHQEIEFLKCFHEFDIITNNNNRL